MSTVRSDIQSAKIRTLIRRTDTIVEPTIGDICISDLGESLAKMAALGYELEVSDNNTACNNLSSLCTQLSKQCVMLRERVRSLRGEIKEKRKEEPTKRGNPAFSSIKKTEE